jgi:hypothetical protein
VLGETLVDVRAAPRTFPLLTLLSPWGLLCRRAAMLHHSVLDRRRTKSMAMLFTRRRIQTPRPVALFGEPIVWVDTARYLGVTLDRRLTWATHIVEVRKKVSQRLGVLGPVLNRRSGLYIRNGVLLYRQLIRPMMDYACPVWRSAARATL